jgi:hypothetical protein
VKNLREELEAGLEYAAMWARRNYFYAHLTFGLVVIASFGSAVIIATDLSVQYKWIPTLVAALPGVAVLINSTLKFEQRALWFYRRKVKCESLLYALRFEDVPEAEISKRWSEFCVKSEDDWPGFGELPGQPSKEKAT